MRARLLLKLVSVSVSVPYMVLYVLGHNLLPIYFGQHSIFVITLRLKAALSPDIAALLNHLLEIVAVLADEAVLMVSGA